MLNEQNLLDIVTQAEAMVQQGQKRKALNLVMEVFDKLLGSTDTIFQLMGYVTPAKDPKSFETVDNFFAEIQPQNYSTTVLLGLLTISLTQFASLPNRAKFFLRCQEVIEKRDPQRAKTLLQGLERLR